MIQLRRGIHEPLRTALVMFAGILAIARSSAASDEINNTRELSVTAHGDLETLVMRLFKARRELVFDALTKPELLKRWFGPPGWTFVVCEVDPKTGGTYRYVWRRSNRRKRKGSRTA